MKKINNVDLLVKIALFLLLILSLIVFNERQKHQLNEIYYNADNTKIELENNIQNGIEAVKYLNASAQMIIENKDRMQLKFAPLVEEYDTKGNYNADHVFDNNVVNEDKANISGYGGLKKDSSTLQEMEMSLYLIPYFKLIKEQNKNFAWVYYYSNKDFVTLYPFSNPEVFVLLPEYKNQPMFQYATPKINPNKNLFFTPLYIDNGGLGLMVTLGLPLYDKGEFLGTTDIDITLESQSAMLKRLDQLGYHSAIINKENEVIAVNNIVKPNTKVIIKIDSLIGSIIPKAHDTQEELLLIDGKYVYSKTFTNAPWKLIYYEDASKLLLRSFFYTIPFFIIMGFIFYLGKLYSRTHKLSVELKEEVIHSEIQEEQLRQKEEAFRTLAENSPDTITRFDRECRRIYVNPSFERIFGCRASDVLGKTSSELSPLPDNILFEEYLQQVIQTGKAISLDMPFINAAGVKGFGNGQIVPEFGSDGSVISVLAIGRDITERKLAEEYLERTKAKLGAVISTIPDLIWVKDGSGVYMMCNPSFEKFFGASCGEIIGKTDYDFISREQADFFCQKDREAIEAGEMRINEEEIVFAHNGQRALLETRKVPVYNDGEFMGVLGIGRDITERKKHEELLRQKESEFRSLTENSPDVIIRYDCEGQRIYINPIGELLFGLPIDEILGKTPLDSSVIPSDVMFMEKLHTVIKTGIPLEFESEFTTPAGEKRWGHTRILPEFDSNEKVVSILSIGRDMTEHKKNEDLFNLKQSRLAQMGEMISMIAHQWRQPLGAISTTAGNLELKIDLQAFDLETKEGQEEQNLYFKERLKKIRGFVENLTATIDDFRNFYKPNKKSVTTTYESIITKVMDIMKSSLDNDNIEIVYNYNSHEEIQMYDSEMMQVILNIFKNAQDNFKEKQIKNPKITVTTFEKMLKICDNGGGIPPEILEKIFDPYFSTKSEKNGTGLGLYMSKTIIEEHHNGALSALNVDDGICITINLTQEEEC